MKTETKSILEAVKNGSLSVDDALLQLKNKPYEDIGFAKVDLHRKIRQGVPEVIYGAGKTPEQIIEIIRTMKEHGQNRILITRLTSEAADRIERSHSITYYEQAKLGLIGDIPTPNGSGTTSGSIKMDFRSSKLTYTNAITGTAGSNSAAFANIQCDSTIGDDAKLVLQALGMLPVTGALYSGHINYWNNAEAERCFFCGGNWYNSSYGLGSFNGRPPRSYSDDGFGFRSAFVEL